MPTNKLTGPWCRDRFLLLCTCLAVALALPTVGCRTVEEGPSPQPDIDVPTDVSAEEAPEPPPLPLWTDDPYAEFPDYRGKRTFSVGSGRSIFGQDASFRKALKDARRELTELLAPHFADAREAAQTAQLHAMHRADDGTVYVLIGIPQPAFPSDSETPPEAKPEPEVAAESTSDEKAAAEPSPEPEQPEPRVIKAPAPSAPAVDERSITMPDEPEPAPVAPVAEPEPVAVTEDAQPSAASTYFSDRGYDFLDMLGIRVGGGTTVYLRARLTKLAMLGGGFFKGKYRGLHGRAVGRWREKRHEGGALVLYEVQYERSDFCGNEFMCDETFLPRSSARPRRKGWLPIDKSAWELADDDHHWADLGLGAGFLAVAADAHISPFQMADFLLGILGIDIADDDARSRASCARTEAAD